MIFKNRLVPEQFTLIARSFRVNTSVGSIRAFKQNLNLYLTEQRADGHPTMSRRTMTLFNRLLIGFVIFLLALPSAGIITEAADTHLENGHPTISPSLISIMTEVSDDERIPITIEFEPEYSSYLIEESFTRARINGFELRTVFRYIPFASVYATTEAITQIAELEGVISVNQDDRIIVEPMNDLVVPQAQINAGYVHPNEILDTDGLWTQGYNGSGITVAVIDSGADGEHPDLIGKLSGFYDLVNDNSDMDPSDGISAYDDNGHGTACAWLVTGSGVGTDYAYTGLAVGAEVLVIKTLDAEGAADDSVIAEGIEYAIAADVDVISLSVGGEWLDSSLYSDISASAAKAAVEAGIVVVVAGGNSGPATNTITSPGIVEEVITVGSSIGATDVVSFSSRGPVYRGQTDPVGIVAKPDLLAPGYNILSGITNDANPYEYPPYNRTQFDADYTLWSGTSASAPQVAALAALLMDKHPALTPIEVKTFLMIGATDLGIDPLEQGYGLANVTRTSDLITSTSGVATLIAPLRYPTLPGTRQVLIIGDTRAPTNATVISTVNRGTLTIQMTGNASQFIEMDDEVFVPVGYSYFSIGLDVPDDLPLSSLGTYTGQVELKSGSALFASMELNLLITTYGGRLLVDMGHHSSLDPDDVSYYRYFSEYLREQGMVIDEYPENWEEEFVLPRAFDAAALASTEVLMIMDTEEAYTQNEIELIHTFVEEGGTLLILSEGFDTAANQPAFSFQYYNQILEPYGIQCEEYWIGENNGEVYGADYDGVVDSSPLTEGVTNLYVLNGGSLTVNPSVAGAQGVVWVDAAKTHAIVAIAESGEGKVIVISDGSILYDTSIYDAVLREADNLKLLENIAEAILPNSPRIYDVILNSAGVGEEANLTAYIFDDDIQSVEISLTDPNGNVIDTPMVESLGYKYTIEFILETTGFYSIEILATNKEGYVRTYSKTILIPVSALDDEFLMTVIFGLLGIVGIALGYVAFLKFYGGRKRRSRFEREWSPEWENDSIPPSIE